MLRDMAEDATALLADAERRAARWLLAWDGQGMHRTATAGDDAGALWLAAEARALGASGGIDVAIEGFALDRLDPVDAYLELGGERIAAVPAFDAPASGDAGVAGRLGPAGSEAEIAVAELSPRAVYSREYQELRGAGGHRGFVILCAGEEPGLALLNAEEFRHPYGVPTIHLSSAERDRILAAAARRAPARLVADSRRKPARGRNTVVTLGIADAGPPLVVMTPRSSWWQSVAERGGGIVCWLESLRALVAAPPRRRVIFTANSGHELGHLGLDDFVARRPGWDRPATEGGATWVHYGANIGAAGGALSLVAPDDLLRDLARGELEAAGRRADTIAPKTLVPSGETRDIHRAGGRYLTLVGTNRWFHLPQDRWPYAVDVAAIARIAGAAARITTALSRRGP
jgi:hypothetical protein